MAKIDLKNIIESLLQHWEDQNITSTGRSMEEIELIEKSNGLDLPSDLKKIYLHCNGMSTLFPNYTDELGFLFYPLEHLVTYNSEFRLKSSQNKIFEGRQCIIFMNYLHKSWWYGILRNTDAVTESYSVVIIPTEGKYKVICSSIGDFLSLYIKDSPVLYDYD